MGNTSHGLPYPDPTSSVDVPRDLKALADAIDPPLWVQSVQRFLSAADRTAKFPAPQKGAVTWRDDASVLEVWTGSAWSLIVTGLPTQLRNESIALQQGPADGNFAQISTGITLTPGTWIVEGGVNVLLSSGPQGSCSCALWDIGGNAQIASSTGEGGTVGATTLAGCRARPTLITVAPGQTFGVCTFTLRSSGSTVQLISLAGAPSSWMSAVRVA